MERCARLAAAACALLLTLADRADARQALPLTNNLVGSYPYGEQLALELTPDQQRAFVAEGSVIRVLDMSVVTTSTPPASIEHAALPHVQPLALEHFQHAGQDWLFVAGGTHGLWAVALCPGLFQTPPVPCGTPAWAPILIDTIDGGYFEHKRCVDVVVEESSSVFPGQSVLYALFAASSDATQSGIGPTEVRAYSFNAGSLLPLASYSFPGTAEPQRPTIGTALALDPGDHASVLVSVGKGGIWRLQLAGGTPPAFTATQLPVPFSGVEYVSDIAVVRAPLPTGARSFLYAALNYGRILEYDLSNGNAEFTAVCGYPEQISASLHGMGSTEVLVAVGSVGAKATVTESSGPYGVNGFWTGRCLGGPLDPDAPELSSSCALPAFYERKLEDPPTSLSQTATYPTGGSISLPQGQGSVNRIVMPGALAGSTARCCVSSTFLGMQVIDVDVGLHQTALVNTHVGKGFGAGEPTVSLVDPRYVRFVYEQSGVVEVEGTITYLPTQPPYDFQFIPQTLGVCGSPSVPPCPSGTSQGSNPCENKAVDPAIFAGNLVGEAHWVDPLDPTGRTEWFVPGRNTIERQLRTITPPSTCDCTTITDCGMTPWNPCAPGWGDSVVFRLLPGSSIVKSGWRPARLTLPNVSSAPSSGASLDPRWIQLRASGIAGGQTPDASGTGVYTHSTADPRLVNGYPAALYLGQHGAKYGVYAVRPQDLQDQANWPCSGSPASDQGFGERIDVTTIPSWRLQSHVELEGTCVPLVSCAGSTHVRQLYNTNSAVFRTVNEFGQTAYVLAVAAGFVGCETPQPQPAGCLWSPYADLPMLVLYDITGTGTPAFQQPVLLRACLGSQPGNAFCVKTKSYGSGPAATVYAFVGDITGRLYVFDVTGSKLFPPATTPYLPATDPLLAIAEFDFPHDAYDGYPANCIDLEIDGTYLYCALNRHGIGVIDVSNPVSPTLVHVEDTPGLVLGLAQRTAGTPPHKQLIVGDSRCGPKVYQQ